MLGVWWMRVLEDVRLREVIWQIAENFSDGEANQEGRAEQPGSPTPEASIPLNNLWNS